MPNASVAGDPYRDRVESGGVGRQAGHVFKRVGVIAVRRGDRAGFPALHEALVGGVRLSDPQTSRAADAGVEWPSVRLKRTMELCSGRIRQRCAMENSLSITALVISAVALLASLAHGGLEGRRQHIREIEQFYLTRYWELQDQAPVDALRGAVPAAHTRQLQIDEHPVQLVDDAAGGKVNVSRLALLYLRMCDDEVRTRRRGMVSDATWREWLAAMQTQTTRWPVADEWAAVKGQGSEEGFAYLRRALRSSDGGFRDTDPCDWSGFMRYWRGLSRSPFQRPISAPSEHERADWPQDD